MRKVGLTGGIASGKTTVARMFQDLGANVTDLDRIAHQTYNPGRPAYNMIIEEFGERVLAKDSTVDRKELGRIVFSDRSKKETLEDIVWPEIGKYIEGDTRKGINIYEAAILFDAGWDLLMDYVIVVTAPEEVRLARMLEKWPYLNRGDAKARINSQMNQDVMVRRANWVIDNGDTLYLTKLKVNLIWDRLICS